MKKLASVVLILFLCLSGVSFAEVDREERADPADSIDIEKDPPKS